MEAQERQQILPGRRRSWPARLYLWATYRLYNEFACAYDLVSWLVSAGGWGRWRRMALDYLPGPRVLEVGFGTGELLIEMARRGLQVCGLEYSPAMHRVAARKMRRNQVQVFRVRARAQSMPFRDGYFDAIVSTFPANYIFDPATLREFARLLRPPDVQRRQPGGRLIIAGLAVIARHPLLRRLVPFFYSPSLEVIELHWTQVAAGAGLRTTVVARDEGWVTVPVLIVERNS